MRAEEEIASYSIKMKAYLAWAYGQVKIIMEKISCLHDVEKDDKLQGIYQLLEVYDAKVEEVDIDANIVDDIDDESDLDS
ncbi:hypothetical protein CHS0354_042198 [Potamilus streckersoni]|uniref:Uncharacterized protein n=1 Tax=Potamilus streckersoni TaxID=2493646 RepID=A0AAE0TLY7_9BIVA|nr:hypothetical protein CHS0354_042198 [Potamilus streckersoni]